MGLLHAYPAPNFGPGASMIGTFPPDNKIRVSSSCAPPPCRQLQPCRRCCLAVASLVSNPYPLFMQPISLHFALPSFNCSYKKHTHTMGACWGRPMTEQEAGGLKVVPHEPPVGAKWVAGEKVHGGQAMIAATPGAGAATPLVLAPTTAAIPAGRRCLRLDPSACLLMPCMAAREPRVNPAGQSGEVCTSLRANQAVAAAADVRVRLGPPLPFESDPLTSPLIANLCPAAATPIEGSEAGGETETAATESVAPGQAGYWAKGGGAAPYHSAYSTGKLKLPGGRVHAAAHALHQADMHAMQAARSSGAQGGARSHLCWQGGAVAVASCNGRGSAALPSCAQMSSQQAPFPPSHLSPPHPTPRGTTPVPAVQRRSTPPGAASSRPSTAPPPGRAAQRRAQSPPCTAACREASRRQQAAGSGPRTAGPALRA